MRTLATILSIAALLLAPVPCRADEAGRIEGVVTLADGTGVEGVSVLLDPGGREAVTAAGGAFSFANVAPGTYGLTFIYGDSTASAEGIAVSAGQATRVDRAFEWDFHYAESVTVYSASRRLERIVDAPAAVTKIGRDEIELEGGAGQVPSLLEFTVGAEPTQNGLYDFNLNARGFNGTLTRRIQVLIDGRDPSVPATKHQDWWNYSFLMEDLESMELLRGPSSALYGPNSVNGVLSLRTRSPKDSPGGQFRLTLGELDTVSGDLRWAGHLGQDWHLKVLAGHTQSESFARSRDVGVEYPGIPPEATSLRPGGIEFDSGSVRLDKILEGGQVVTTEAGISRGGGETYLAQAGRFQELDVKRWWGRFNVNAPRWNAAYYHNERHGDQLAMQANVPLVNDESNDKLELQGNLEAAEGRVRLVGGVSYLEEDVDSAGPSGAQTLYLRPVHSDQAAVFGQVDWQATPKVKLVGALRWDEGTLYERQLSPKASVVFTPAAGHSLRLGLNKAFQVGNYTELFLSVPGGAPLDLSAVEASLQPLTGGVPLGLGFVPIFAFGNPDLDVEKITSVEAGYRGALGAKSFLTVDVYANRMKDFISDLLFGINPAYPPYQAPAAIPAAERAQVEAALLAALPGLTNDPAGNPMIVVSNANTGTARSRGVEVAHSWQPRERWLVDMAYAWFDFEIDDAALGAKVNPNAPEHSASAGVTYRRPKVAASLKARWVNGFDWASGVFVGPVPSYHLVNANMLWEPSERWAIGVNVSNLFDEGHYQVFGGDVLGRRALAHATVRW